ncbi:MAG: zincin-like metallopeptidase domain-containing protein [Thermoguttaceae bacterium]|jgi:antirestriction protein ArdC|nr:zincin-like metallopeptidase domain-containing protein [Thermoguttaceae bacterium]
MSSNAAIRRQLTDQIVKAIEQGVKPWRRPWRKSPNAGRPINLVSRERYKGINPLLLELHRMEHGLSSKWYGTYQQWERLHCQVMRRPDHVEPGSWGAKIVFYRPITKTVTDEASGDEKVDRFFVMRTYTVFSADQVEGADAFRAKEVEGKSVPDFEPAEDLIAATAADIRYGGEQAFYSRQGDYIQVPQRHRFDSSGGYYETVLHELGHWSEVRLDWDYQKAGYAMNELVAEISASFLSTELGVPQGESLENHASYLKSWLEGMKGDSSFIFKASTQASKVADYLLGFVGQTAAKVA